MKRVLTRLLPLVIIGVAGLLDLPWLSRVEWQGSSVTHIERVADVRPALVDGHTLYAVLGIAADTLLPGSTPLALNLLAFLAALVALLAVARLRRRLEPSSTFAEPLGAALALAVCGLFWRQSVAADAQTVEIALTTVAVAIAWGGRPVAGMACFQLALFSSAPAILNLPLLLLAIRRRHEWKPALTWLLPWLAFAVIVRPQITPAGCGGPSAGGGHALLLDGFISVLGMTGVLPLAVLGAVAVLGTAGPRRRFLGGALLALLLHILVMSRTATWGLGYVALLPWVAVLAAGGMGVLRRLGEGLGLGRQAGWAVALAVLLLNGVVSERHLVAPCWRRAITFDALSRNLTEAYRQVRVAGSWSDVRLFELANREGHLPRTVLQDVPMPRHRPADAAARAALDRLLEEGDMLLLFDQRMAARLNGGSSICAQLLSSEGDAASPRKRLGEFEGGLELRQVHLVPPRPRPGRLLAVSLSWRIGRPPARLPKVAVALLDGAGQVRHEVSYWLGLGLVDPRALVAGRELNENLILELPDDLEAGEYGVEVAVYRPLRGDNTLRDLRLGTGRQDRWAVVASATPGGVTPSALRAATLRIGP